MVVQPGLCRNWSETPKTGFLTTRLILQSLDAIRAYVVCIYLKIYFLMGWLVSIRLGTDEERGVKKWRKHFSAQEDVLTTSNDKTYDLPLITGCLRRQKCSAYIPFLPPFKYSIGHLLKRCFSKCKVSQLI